MTDLNKLWEGIQMRYAGSDNPATFRCALLGVACDLPAGKKCGFLSYTANLGCSWCFEQFSRGFGNENNYANFNTDSWELRTSTRHRSDVVKVLKCKSKTQKVKEESRLGCRYSVLLELPYFRLVEMLLVDPMHNLFLGTAKHFARNMWIDQYILDTPSLARIETRLKSITVPQGLGRLLVSIKHGTFLTAEQWMNWTSQYFAYQGSCHSHIFSAGGNCFSVQKAC